ncbi:MAG: Serine aminopeptidase [Planctomycetota bacterium]|nr:Serine aminopeptidase [Planctomycetota bacterium]
MSWAATLVLVGLLFGQERGDALVVRVPVSEAGSIDGGELMVRLGKAIGVKVERPKATFSLPVRGPAGLVSRSLMAQTLGPCVSIEVKAEEVVLRVDPEALTDAQRPALRERLQMFAKNTRFLPGDPTSRYGFTPQKSYRPNNPDRPTICLIHGINSSSDSFVHLIPALESEGFGVVVYNYPYDRDLDEMVVIFASDWAAFRREKQEQCKWTILTHSMGSLLARSYVEGEHYLEDVSHLFLIGPTNRGAAVANGQKLLRLARRLQPAREKEQELQAGNGDDLGAAAEDLLPGSKFLEALNARPRRQGVSYHILAGSGGFLSPSARTQVEAYLATVTGQGGLLGGLSRFATSGVGPVLDELTAGTGDGCVTLASTRLDGVIDHETIPANHVELIRGPLLYPDPGPIACLPFILKRIQAKPIVAGR